MGPRSFWEKVVGNDAGAIDFYAPDFEQRLGAKPNIGLATPADYFTGSLGQRVQHIVPNYDAAPAELISAIEQAMMALPNIELAKKDMAAGTLRFIRFSPTIGFPDTINVQLVERANGQTSFLALARARVGYSDLGMNAKLLGQLIAAVNKATA
ncbi:MAG: DUF1499 domain-containing protein [Pseudomonadota bacterium]